MSEHDETASGDAADSRRGFRSAVREQRTGLLIVGLIGAIVVGFVLGFLARIPLEDSSSNTPGAGSVEVGFAQDMIVHHSQAVEMAAIALSNTTDPAIRGLAYDILTTQQNQIGQMQGWLHLWDQPLLPTGGHMGWMESGHGDGHGGGHHGTASTEGESGSMTKMPGMATSEEISALRQATGVAADVQFLQLMLRHHQGGLPMMEYAAEHASVPAVRQLAEKMVATQQNESDLMTSMLAERGAQPLPMN